MTIIRLQYTSVEPCHRGKASKRVNQGYYLLTTYYYKEIFLMYGSEKWLCVKLNLNEKLPFNSKCVYDC